MTTLNQTRVLYPTLDLVIGEKWLGKTYPVLRQALFVVLGSLVVAAFAQLEIRLPWTIVPVSGQTLGVLLVGASLGSKRGAMSLALYLLEGAAGLPVFSGGAFGIYHLFGPTGGYLFGFVAAAFVVGLFAEKGVERSFKTSWLPFLLGHTVIFAFGLTVLSFFVGKQNAMAQGLLPFIPGELIKTLIAAGALPLSWRLLDGSSRSR